ncbi:hypothetical protein Tco_1256912 [Tanacetum coccineum]
MPEQILVGEFLPPYYISQLEDSIIISGSFNFGDFRIIYAWEIEVDDGEVSSYRQLFTIPYPAEYELKLIGFTKDKQPIVEASFLQQFHQSLQVFNPSIQRFQNVGVEANHGAILWNPSIRKFSGIEVPYMANRPRINKIVWGFGVRPDTLDPTIVNISMPFYGDGPWHVLLYTLNSDTWRVLGNARLPRIGIRIKRSWGVAVVGSCIFWGCSKTIYNDDGSSYNLYMLVSFDLINHRFHVLDIPTQLRNDLPVPFYISKLGNSLVISGNHIDNDENRYICAWLLEVEAAVVTSWRVLFVMPSQNIAKLIGFTMDDDPIVVVDMGHEIVHTLQVYDRPSQQFHTLGIVGNGGSFFIGPYKESLILLNV